jgi:hypothetical protein
MNLNPNAIPTLLLSVALFCLFASLANRLTSRLSRTGLLILATALAIPGALFVLYYAHLFDNAAWFYQFRALPDSELAAAGLGAFAGFLQSVSLPKTLGEKLIAPIVLGVLLFVPFIKSVLDPVDYSQLQRKCEGDVCLQSTPSTCGPTSAATLLKLLGQNASEEELARECFTYRGGTEIWYIARAFRKRGFTADFVIQPPARVFPPAAAIAGVVLPGGAGHFVAIMNENNDEITIGDPLKGKRTLPRAEIANAYHFTGFFLVIRRRPS